MEVLVDLHALKHGLTEEEILYAWKNYVRKQHRRAPKEDRVVVVALGFCSDGRLVQMVGVDKWYGVLIPCNDAADSERFGRVRADREVEREDSERA